MANRHSPVLLEVENMHSRTGLPLNRVAGGIKVWTAILILALCCVVAVVALQVQEYLFYKEAPSVWVAPGAIVPPVPPIAPMLESAASTSQPSAEVDGEPKPEESAETESEVEVENEAMGEDVPESEPDE